VARRPSSAAVVAAALAGKAAGPGDGGVDVGERGHGGVLHGLQQDGGGPVR